MRPTALEKPKVARWESAPDFMGRYPSAPLELTGKRCSPLAPLSANSRPGSPGTMSDVGPVCWSDSRPASPQTPHTFGFKLPEVERNVRSPGLPTAFQDVEVYGRNAGIKLCALQRSSSTPSLGEKRLHSSPSDPKHRTRECTPQTLSYLVSDACEADQICKRRGRRRSIGTLRSASAAVIAFNRMSRRRSSV